MARLHHHHPQDETTKMTFVSVCTPTLIHAFSFLRDRNTPRDIFVHHAKLATRELVPFGLNRMPFQEGVVETPLGRTTIQRPEGRVVIIAILRAGILMTEVFDEQLSRRCIIGHIGIRRTGSNAFPEVYYENIPRLTHDDLVIIPDPMLATGGSVCKAIEMVIAAGAKEQHITTLHLVSAPHGVQRINLEFPSVAVFVAAMDADLNDHFYIRGPGLFPTLGGEGLGDFGDRVYGTSPQHR
jgi:uracil phosphoribosyltransferase